MNQVQCSHCQSVNVTVVSTDPPRAVVAIHCFGCGKASEVRSEQFTVDTEDLPRD